MKSIKKYFSLAFNTLIFRSYCVINGSIVLQILICLIVLAVSVESNNYLESIVWFKNRMTCI